MKRRARWIVLLALLLGAGGGGWILGAASQSPSQAAARAEPPPASWITANVERRVLDATVIQRGDVRAEISISVPVPSSVEGAGVLTQVVSIVGNTVVEGTKVGEVSGRPIFVFEGTVPVYRTLRPTMSGDDVRQLQEALQRLGFAVEPNGVFGESTKMAIAAFYQEAGYEPVPSSASSALTIAQAESAVSAAERRLGAAQSELELAADGKSESEITQARVALNQARRAAESARQNRDANIALAQQELDAAVRARDRLAADPDASQPDIDQAQFVVDQAVIKLDQARRDAESLIVAADEAVLLAGVALDDLLAEDDATAAEREIAAAEDELDQARAVLTAAVATSGPSVPQGEIVFVPSLPARVVGARTTLGPLAEAGTGGSATQGASVVELAAGRLVVSTRIHPVDLDRLPVGLTVELFDEARSVSYEAEIADVDPEPTIGIDGQLGHEAILVPRSALPDSMAGTNVRVTATMDSTGGPALIVPLAAVSSNAAGEIRVTVVDDPNDLEPTDVAVRAGLSADGFVVVEPVDADALEVGDLVVVGR